MSKLTDLRFRLAAVFRERRRRAFLRLFPISSTTTILDVGGYNRRAAGFSSAPPLLSEIGARITTLNLSGPADLIADARAIPLADKSFEIAFSNSVIEHVGTEADQRRFANEIRRVGRSYYVQTPNRWFPLELHWAVPLFLLHWLPRQWFDPSPRSTRNPLDPPLRVLSARELRSMFPEATILRERFLGLTKSIIAIFRAR